MFAAITTFSFKEPLTAGDLSALEREVVDVIASMPGFKSYFAMQPSELEVNVLIAWDAEASSLASRDRVLPAIQRIIGHKLAGEPQRKGGAVVFHR